MRADQGAVSRRSSSCISKTRRTTSHPTTSNATPAFVKPSIGAGALTLPGSWYTSPAIFEREQREIFGAQWLCVGREETIARTGDFFIVERAGENLIITRDDTGDVHAFFNVCRHRGTRLCEDAGGRFAGSIQCPYHAWTYALDGALKVARNMSDVPGFDRADYPLKEAAVACGTASSSSTCRSRRP